MYRYVFVLGTAFDLCTLELTSYLKKHQNIDFHVLHEPLVEVTSKELLDTRELMAVLGGTIKIALIEAEIPNISAEILLPYISQSTSPSVNFGISAYSPLPTSLSSLLSELKREWPKGSVVRYVLPKEGTTLSSVVVNKQNLDEYLLYKNKTTWIIAKTEVVQDVDMWSQREFDRPASDVKKGMLPAKVARMMVNMAISNFKFQISNSQITLLDPFCGVGTVLIEALDRGLKVIGSDIFAPSIEKAQQNLEWYSNQFDKEIETISSNKKFKLITHDVVHLDSILPANSVDMVVTEPYLGELYEKKGDVLYQKGQRVTTQVLQNNLKGLEKLYLGALKVLYKLLTSGGIIVIIFPLLDWQGKTFSVKKVVDRCETLGYTRLERPVTYSRPDAFVKRQIYVFRKLDSQNSKLKSEV